MTRFLRLRKYNEKCERAMAGGPTHCWKSITVDTVVIGLLGSCIMNQIPYHKHKHYQALITVPSHGSHQDDTVIGRMSTQVQRRININVNVPLDCLLGLYWTGLTLLNGFSFLVIFFFFYFGSCGRLSWLNCQLSSAS